MGKGHLLRDIDTLDDLSSHLVGHFTLIAVRPQLASMDVPFSELSWNPLASHVLTRILPRETPPLADRFERVNARIRPLSGFSSCNETGASLFLRSVLVRLWTRLRFCQSASQ